jgi:hypothetical protein
MGTEVLMWWARRTSQQDTFPVVGDLDSTANGEKDAFVVKVSADGSSFEYAGFLGGDANDSAHGIAVDAAGNAYVTGTTVSTESTFPMAIGPDLTSNGGGFGDVFVTKIAADGASIVYSGFIGGDGNDGGNDIAVDEAGNAYVVGSTSSTGSTFPLSGGLDQTPDGVLDGFVAKVSPERIRRPLCRIDRGRGPRLYP